MAKAKKFEAPKDGYASLEEDALDALSDVALDEYNELIKIDDDELTDEQVDRMLELKQAVKDIRAEKVERVEAAEERAQKIADAKAGIDEDEDDDAEGDDEEGAEEEEADVDEEEEEADVEEEDAEVDADKEAILASGRTKTKARPVSRRRRKVEPEEEEPKGRQVAITAQADVKGFAGGQAIDMDGMVEAYMARLQGMPGGGRKKVGKGSINSYGVARMVKDPEAAYSEYTINDRTSDTDAWKNIMAAAKSTKTADALMAAGGWCAPSENFYDLCQWETTSGGLDLPEITVVRGGINFTKGPDFSSIFDATGFLQTEADAIAGEEKTFLEVECPDWEEVRLDAIGYGVKAPILTASPAGFPELVRRYLEGALVAHWHKVNAYVIDKVLGFLGASENFAELGSASGDVLNAIEVAAWSLRYKFRLGENATLEAMFPMWIKGALRADLARRTGVDMLAVTDGQIQSWFTMRGIRPQYVFDWAGQDLTGTTNQFPATVQFGIWPAGAFVKGSNNIISLDAIYDSTEIVTNTYTAAFFEEAILVANTCGDGRLFTVGLDLYGRTGAAELGSAYAIS